MNNHTKRAAYMKRRICQIRTTQEMASLLGITPLGLAAAAATPQYHRFSIPKRTGGTRLIEAPAGKLKKLQDVLNDHLQPTYWFQKTDAAYGFVMNLPNETHPRHILTNASRHLDQAFLLNIDLQDFFHQISTQQVEHIFSHPPFAMDDETAELLARLCTHAGRLPMGAPTSPVLSNFAAQWLDQSLSNFADSMNWVYTRYADDMTFSSDFPMQDMEIQRVKNLIENHGFIINPKKVQYFQPHETKTVTNLVVREKRVELPVGFLEELEIAIQKLQKNHQWQQQMCLEQPIPVIEKMIQRIEGGLRFAEHILGIDDPDVEALQRLFAIDLHPPPVSDDQMAASWLDFPYF